MNPVLEIGVWTVLFVGTHLFISSRIIRPRLVDRIGEQAFRGMYSLVAFATLIPLVVVFAHHKHSTPVLWYLRATAPIRWLAWLMMLAALIFLVAGLLNPNPGAIGAAAPHRVRTSAVVFGLIPAYAPLPYRQNLQNVRAVADDPSFVGFGKVPGAPYLARFWLSGT